MKKFRSLFALLLLGSFVLSGCGDKGNNSIPGDNTQQGGGDQGGSSGGSGSGGNQQGGGQQGGGSQGGEGQGGEGGGQQGGGEGGGQQGGGEVPVDSQFVNKKFIFDSVSYPDNPTIEGALNANYQNAYASFFQNGKFELISVINTYTMALLGTYTVADDDSYARLDVLKEYDGQHEAYNYVTSGTFVTNLRYNQGLQKYVLPMTQYVEDLHGNISFDVYLTLSNDLPEPANLPEDPNGETFDPAYQVYKDVWDRLFVDRGLLHASTSNYKVTSGDTIFEVDDGEKYYEHYPTSAPGAGLYWERTSIVGNRYYYNHTIVAGGEVSPVSPVDYGVDFFDSSIGLAPIPFNWMSYNSVGHYYYRNSFTYQNSWTGSVTLNNYRVYFGQYYRVLKITYEDSAHQSFEFNFSNYNQVEIDIPEAGGGGGGGGQGGGGEGGQGGGGEGGGQQGGGGNIPFNDTVTWESVIGDPPGPEITPEQAETIVNGILTYRASTKVNNARVEEYENGSVINRVEFDTDSLAAYSWDADDNEEFFTFVESSTGYYYFTDPDLDNTRPEIQDWYCTYSNIDEYDYDWENEATDFNSRFKGLMIGAYDYANAEIDIDTSTDYSALGGTVKYYSSGVGHIRAVAEVFGIVMVTEWKDYKPLLSGSPEYFTYYSYDVSVKKPESRENYTLYGAI